MHVWLPLRRESCSIVDAQRPSPATARVFLAALAEPAQPSPVLIVDALLPARRPSVLSLMFDYSTRISSWPIDVRARWQNTIATLTLFRSQDVRGVVVATEAPFVRRPVDDTRPYRKR